MIDWFKKHRVLFALICVVILLLLMGIPFVINILFKINTTTDIFVAEWSAGDALGYYGAILSFLGTVVLGALALYQNHIIKTEADKKAALAEEQERAENMPRFFLRFQCASGFCGSLKFAVMNVSNNIAYTVDVYDIKIKGGSKTIWESDDIEIPIRKHFVQTYIFKCLLYILDIIQIVKKIKVEESVHPPQKHIYLKVVIYCH